MEEYDFFIDVSPAYNGMSIVLRETAWRALYIILFFIAAEVFLFLGSSQLSGYPQFQALFDLANYSVWLICATYTVIFVVIETLADIIFGIRHYIQAVEAQNKQLRDKLHQADIKLTAFSYALKAEAAESLNAEKDSTPAIEANQEPGL